MNAIILAAGMGTRLAETIPKPLIPLKGEETIIDHQIRNLTQYMSIDDIFVVVGYKKEIIMEKYPELTYIYNKAYAQTNTAKSLLMAIKKIEKDVIWLNGDVVFDGKVLLDLVGANDSAVLVQPKECGEEEIKYSLDDPGFIKEISKEVRDPVGEAVGINKIQVKDIPSFIRHLEAVGDKDYFEEAMENMITENKTRFLPVDINGHFCVEVDFPEDLDMAKKYINAL